MRTIDADALKESIDAEYFDRCAVIKMIDAAPTVEQWISVEDQLPETDETVLVACEEVGHRYVTTDCYSGKRDTPFWLLHDGRVTHWQPLPDLPEEGK